MAGIIKASGFTSTARGAAPAVFHFDDIKERINSTLGAAQSQAVTIIKQANDQAGQLRQNAQKQGQQAAAQAAQQTANAALDDKLATLMPALEQTVKAIHQSKDAWKKNWETKVVHLAVAIAERVVRRELRQAPDITLDLVSEAIELAAGSGQIKVHLNPRDHETLGERVGQLTAQFRELAPADIVADEQVTPGGCIVKTEFGEIDQQIESQLARIEEELA